MNKLEIVSSELNLPLHKVENSIKLLIDDGATIPFVSRYRKEATGGLDEVQLESILLRYQKLADLEKRREAIISSITEQGAMTPELKNKIDACYDQSKLEDIYLPYKPKRRTRATIAKEKGLEPLAYIVMLKNDSEVENAISRFVKGDVDSEKDAIDGAVDIVAEWVSENEKIRDIVRSFYERNATLTSKVVKKKEQDATKYSGYFDYSEPLKRVTPNRYLAVCRGENEGFLKVSIKVDDEIVNERLIGFYEKNGRANIYKKRAIKDSFSRLISPSIENETRSKTKELSDDKAINIFTANLRQLLLASPLGGKSLLAIDPGFRTGCKIVCLDKYGDFVCNDTMYPHAPQNSYDESKRKIETLIKKYNIEAVAIGDGTAGRETESFISELIAGSDIKLFMVSEDGASIYSASAVAREEFPDYDVTVRGAISIGRRLIDPMAELVKIDPKSIGVGEYQHDVEQAKLKNALSIVVESCVSNIGVNLNTASYHVLTYVSGIGKTLAKNITEYRSKTGHFKNRKELLKVPRLGAKVYEQAAGFLRIADGSNPLDNSSVHPESYDIVNKIAQDLGVKSGDLVGNKTLIATIDTAKYVTEGTGLVSIKEILNELSKPTVDPRGEVTQVEFAADVKTINDLTEGRELDGIVTNITSFGAFVDIGVKQDGLVHISNMANKFVSSPLDIVSLHQKVRVKVLEIDQIRGRIGLTMKF